MGGFADFLENELLDHVLGAEAYNAPATVYVGLSTTTITDAGGNITEPGNGYARVAITNNATNWPAAAGGAKSNGTPITFPAATEDWGTIVDFFIADAAQNGNILVYGTLSSAQAIASGQTASFAVGELDVTLS